MRFGVWISRVRNHPDTTHHKAARAVCSATDRAKKDDHPWRVFTKSSEVNIYGNNYWEGHGTTLTKAEFRKVKK